MDKKRGEWFGVVKPVDLCLDHSGCEARISQCEKNEADIFLRMRAVEITVWKATAASGITTAILVVILERLLHVGMGG